MQKKSVKGSWNWNEKQNIVECQPSIVWLIMSDASWVFLICY